MLYVSLFLNVALSAAAGYLWLKNREHHAESERTAREFELMMQARSAEQRTELLQLHAQLMHSQQAQRLESGNGTAPEARST